MPWDVTQTGFDNEADCESRCIILAWPSIFLRKASLTGMQQQTRIISGAQGWELQGSSSCELRDLRFPGYVSRPQMMARLSKNMSAHPSAAKFYTWRLAKSWLRSCSKVRSFTPQAQTHPQRQGQPQPLLTNDQRNRTVLVQGPAVGHLWLLRVLQGNAESLHHASEISVQSNSTP